MTLLITGLHHVTATVDNPQKNLDFYTGFLGLRLVKKTVNFDNPNVYHFYFGNGSGDPGTIMTTFPYEGLTKGRKGAGQLTVTAFSVAADSLDYWQERLNTFDISCTAPQQRFNETFIQFDDYDGLTLELVASDRDTRPGWSPGGIPAQHAIKGFYTVELCVNNASPTAYLLTEFLQYRPLLTEGARARYETGAGGPGTYVDILAAPERQHGLNGAGTVHHVAFRTPSEETQWQIRTKLDDARYNVTEVLDRQYFRSIYFREPGGILFEVATDPPGFATDEELSRLGEELKLPPWLERYRTELEQSLPRVHTAGPELRG